MTQATNIFTYLDYRDWSARFDPTCFYTIQVQGYNWVTSQEQLHQIVQSHIVVSNLTTSPNDGDPMSDIHHKIPMNCRLPTYYYKIIVYRGHQQQIVYRSYSQFEWLYQQLRVTTSKQQIKSNTSSDRIVIPHPLQGNSSKNECDFLGGPCWVVLQIQEFLDYLEQQQQQKPRKKSTSASSIKEVASLMGSEHYKSKFADTRCQQLSNFLAKVLEQRGRSSSSLAPEIIYANHRAVRLFLEL